MRSRADATEHNTQPMIKRKISSYSPGRKIKRMISSGESSASDQTGSAAGGLRSVIGSVQNVMDTASDAVDGASNTAMDAAALGGDDVAQGVARLEFGPCMLCFSSLHSMG